MKLFLKLIMYPVMFLEMCFIKLDLFLLKRFRK